MTALECLVPKGVILVSAGVDFQVDRAELEFIGYGIGEESWGLGNLVLSGDFTAMHSPGRPWAYDQIEAALTREFIREDKARLHVCAAGFDTGYAASKPALRQYLRPRFTRRYYPLKGASVKWAPAWARGRREEGFTLFIIGTNRLKTIIYNRAGLTTVGPGYMHIPKTDDYEVEWFKQLLAEDSHTEYQGGQQITVFEMPSSPNSEDASDRNEALDKRVYSLAALYIRGAVNWDFEESRNLSSIPAIGESNAKKKPLRESASVSRSGLGRGWNL